MKSRIWQLGMHWDRSGGGADRYFDDLVRGLGDDVAAAAAFGDASGCFPTARSLGPATAPLWKRRAAIRAFGSEMARDPNALAVSHFALYGRFIGPFVRHGRHVVHFHGPWSDEAAVEGAGAWAVLAKRLIERGVYRRAARCITLSRAFRDLLVDRFGVSPARVEVVPGCFDDTRFRRETDRSRERFGMDPGARVIVCVRRMVRRVGVSELLEAFEGLVGRHPGVQLHLAGRGPLEREHREWAALRRLPVFFHGHVPDADLPAFYRAADVSVVPSQALEGFGLVCIESLACGTPVFVTPVGGLPEVVEPLDRGLVLPGSAPGAIAAGLERWLAGEFVLPRGEDCEHYASRNFSRDRMVNGVRAVYERAVA
ncbi:MAG: glycosyltransferase family 4 protein [Terrimicrobiaceae bacterium]|nr:glycosyltransferase family 4 protein [Terrimicrobiaceae bacterium]